MRPDRTLDRVVITVRNNHKQIIVAIRPWHPSGAGTEQEDLLGVELGDESPDDFGQHVFRHAFHQFGPVSEQRDMQAA
jgi:hypothetical protein